MNLAIETRFFTKPKAVAGRAVGDRVFKMLTFLMAMSVLVLIFLIGYELARGSNLSLRKFGWRFLMSSEWDPVN